MNPPTAFPAIDHWLRRQAALKGLKFAEALAAVGVPRATWYSWTKGATTPPPKRMERLTASLKAFAEHAPIETTDLYHNPLHDYTRPNFFTLMDPDRVELGGYFHEYASRWGIGNDDSLPTGVDKNARWLFRVHKEICPPLLKDGVRYVQPPPSVWLHPNLAWSTIELPPAETLEVFTAEFRIVTGLWTAEILDRSWHYDGVTGELGVPDWFAPWQTSYARLVLHENSVPAPAEGSGEVDEPVPS